MDMDAFYAAVEQRENRTCAASRFSWRGGKRGVVTTASYEAGRSAAAARCRRGRPWLCPHAIVVPMRMSVYAGNAANPRHPRTF